MASIKKNFAFNALLTTANYIFPMIVFPYVSRVLGVSNIGICNYVDSIIQNFILISTMGIGIVGIREVVAAKHDRIQLNRTFSSIFYVNALFTLVTIAALVACAYVVDDFREYRSLLFIGIAKLLGNFLMIEWFFRGLEDFRYITIRSILVRCAYVLSVFVLIQEPEDYPTYFTLTVGIFVANAILNLIYGRRFVSLTLNPLPLTTFLKPILILGVYMILTNLYFSFNTMWLGMETNDTQVGYFSTATKLFQIFIALFTAFTTVMLPRMTDYLKEGQYDVFRSMLSRTINVLFALAIPMVFYGIIYADDIVMVIAGPGYEQAAMPMQICMPLLFVIGYEQIIVIQALMPMRKDKAILVNSIVGGSVALLLCFTIVGSLQAVGAAIVWLGSEVSTMICSSVLIHRYIGLGFPWKRMARTVLLNVPLVIVLYWLHGFEFFRTLQWGHFSAAAAGGLVLMTYTVTLLFFVVKDPMFVAAVNKILKRGR